MLLLRSLLAFLALPGVFAGLLPWLLVSNDPRRGEGLPAGAAILVIGLVILFWTVRDFYVAGRGTLAPWDPPRKLVVVGLFRLTRNPMYIGVLTILVGWALWAGSPSLWIYLVIMAIAFHVRILMFEEPTLKRLFEAEWEEYRAHVPRWLPRLRPWPAGGSGSDA